MGDARFPTGFGAAVRRFNAGEFFEAHEGFEELLDAVEGDDRWKLLIALIQVSVGYHKLFSTHPGAVHMLRLGAEKLAAFPAVAWGVAVGRYLLRRRRDGWPARGRPAARPRNRRLRSPAVRAVRALPEDRAAGGERHVPGRRPQHGADERPRRRVDARDVPRAGAAARG